MPGAPHTQSPALGADPATAVGRGSHCSAVMGLGGMSHMVTMAPAFPGLGAALNLLYEGELPGVCQPHSGILVCAAQKRGGFFEEPWFSVSLLICSWATSQQVWMAEEHFLSHVKHPWHSCT